MSPSKKLASFRLVGIFSPIEAKHTANTMCICEYFGKKWVKKIRQDGGRWVFMGSRMIYRFNYSTFCMFFSTGIAQVIWNYAQTGRPVHRGVVIATAA